MKRFILLMAVLATACSSEKFTLKKETCIVTETLVSDRYSGVLPEKDYFVKTDCGYSMATNRQYNVGDTIVITVYYVSKN